MWSQGDSFNVVQHLKLHPAGAKNNRRPQRLRLMRISKLSNLLAHCFSLREQVEVIRSTGFGICARHVESAERMASYCGTCAFAIDVEIADMELTDRAFNLVTRAGIHSTSEAKFRIVRDLQRMVVVF